MRTSSLIFTAHYSIKNLAARHAPRVYGEARHLGAKSTKYEPPSSPAMRAQYAVDAKIDVGRTPITTEFVTINPIRRHAFRGTPDHSRDPRPAHSAQRRRLTSSIAEHQKTSEGHHVAGAASRKPNSTERLPRNLRRVHLSKTLTFRRSF